MCKTGDVADPLVVVVGGPNGAGKSTTAPRLLRGALAVREFVNADAIAQGLSAFRPETVAFAAGRVMLARLRALAAAGDSFAFETTLASRNFAPWLRTLKAQGFKVHVAFLSLPTADLAVARVAERVRQGVTMCPRTWFDVDSSLASRTSSLSSCPWQTLGRCSTTRELADHA